MRLYLDDNFADPVLVRSFRRASHHVHSPLDFGLVGALDAKHLCRAIREGLHLLTKDRDDFLELHELVLASGGHHPGILVVRYGNDSKRDMKTKHIVAAVGKLEQAGISLTDQWIVPNQWR